MNIESRLKHFPISFFSIIMGLAGFTLVLQKAEHIFSFENTGSTYVLYAVAVLFAYLAATYAAKIFYYFPDVKEEFNNPIRLSFFPTFSISIILLSIGFLEVNMTISKYLWIAGTLLHFLATVVILSLWVRQTKFEITHFNPAWFIPIVGNILVPIAGTSLFSHEISWFFYSIGIVFWILLFTIFLYRIIFHNPLPTKLLPTFFILIAPPALGFISYVKLNGGIDNFSKILYYFALFLVIFLLAQAKMFYGTKFYLSWWAYSFPIAAITVGTSLMLQQTGLYFYKIIFLGLMAMLTLFVLVLLINTAKSIIKGKICIKEE